MDQQLCAIARAGQGLRYCIGFSYVLEHLGIIEQAHDVDVMVDYDDFDVFVSRLAYDRVHDVPPSPVYQSEKFLRVTLDGVDMDIMANYTIHYHGVHRYTLDNTKFIQFIDTPCGRIPLMPLAELCDLYGKMPKKNDHHRLIRQYLEDDPTRGQ